MDIQNYLTDDETIRESFDYQPYIVRVVPNLLSSREYFLTEKRLIEARETPGARGVDSIPLNKIISTSQIRSRRLALIVASVISLLVFLLSPPVLGLFSFTAASGILFVVFLAATAVDRGVLPIVVTGVLGVISAVGTVNFAAPFGLLYILQLILIVVTGGYALLAAKAVVVANTANPNVSISIPGSQQDAEVKRFVDEIQQHVTNEKEDEVQQRASNQEEQNHSD